MIRAAPLSSATPRLIIRAERSVRHIVTLRGCQKFSHSTQLSSSLNCRCLRTCRITWTSVRAASAEAGSWDGSQEVLHSDDEIIETARPEAESGTPAVQHAGMAEAFGISPKTAFAITSAICVAALICPLFMQSFTSAAATKIKVLTYITLLCGFYMAWNIGANDVANAMGTSVGSGALTLRQAVLVAAVLEFSGAFLVGSHVSHTMQNGILRAEIFAGKDKLLFAGLLSSLAAAGTWLQVASWYGWPVSTTHCIIGAMVGFGIVFGGLNAVYWSSLARVVSSWVVSPVCGATVSYIVYRCIRHFVYNAANPGQAAVSAAPVAVFIGVSALAFTSSTSTNLLLTAGQSLLFGSLGAVAIYFLVQRQLGALLGEFCKLGEGEKLQISLEEAEEKGGYAASSEESSTSSSSQLTPRGPTGTQLRIVYSVFGYLQVLSACFMSFAHGANDVANAIGPISAALSLLQTASSSASAAVTATAGVPTAVLAWGGFGIVAGLLVWGYRVIATIGKRITELTPTRGFAAEFAAATVVVVASRLGLPISATHTLVGAVMGVGLARGMNSVRTDVVKEIVASWLVTIPIGAILSVSYALVIFRCLPSLA